MVHYVLQPRHIFKCVFFLILMLVPGGLQLLIMSTCFAGRPVTGINKFHVLTARAHENSKLIHDFIFINKWLLISCDTGINAIMGVDN